MQSPAADKPAPWTPRRAPRRAIANIRDARLATREWGDPAMPPVVLLHGWMDASSSWQFLVDELPDPLFARHRWCAFDWRGFGDSAWPAADTYWFAEYHADLDALLDHFSGNGPVTLIGHSMGGNIACIYAGLRPTRVARLVSLEGFGLPDMPAEGAPERIVQWLDHLRASPGAMRPYPRLDDVAERLRRANPRLSVPRSLYLAAEQAKPVEGGFALKHDPRHKSPGPYSYRLAEAMAAWRRITAPTLWVQGDRSDLLTRFHGADDTDLASRAACVANIRRATIADAGHMLQHDQPVALAQVLADFFAR
ncbi:MAG: alpha/beta hydrolase [Betaproteobacteria bacterium]|nr:alpha/beta hydrolase [Betaproteobacteria bacterium]